MKFIFLLFYLPSIPVLGAQITLKLRTHYYAKEYELKDHRGNVTTVIQEKIKPQGINQQGTVSAYSSSINLCSDYTAFGAKIEERSHQKKQHRYGFQGQETDHEIKGTDHSINFKYRMHDPRLGRFFATDPLSDEYPWNSPYAFSENRVMDAIELEGLEKVLLNDGYQLNEQQSKALLGNSYDPKSQNVYAIDKKMNADGSFEKYENLRSLNIDYNDFMRIAGLAYGESGFSKGVIERIPYAIVNHDRILDDAGVDKYSKYTINSLAGEKNSTLHKMRNKWTDEQYAHETHYGADGNPAFRAFMGIDLNESINFSKNISGRNENKLMKLAVGSTIKAIEYKNSHYASHDPSGGAVGWQGADIKTNDFWSEKLYIHSAHKTNAFTGWSNSNALKDSAFETTGVYKGAFGTSVLYKPTEKAFSVTKTGGL